MSDNKKQYRQLIQITKEIIDQWDPIGLLEFCPSNEYDMEIESIAAVITKNIDADTLASKIMHIFQDYFGSDAFSGNHDECLKISNSLIQKIQEEGCSNKRPQVCGPQQIV